MLFNNNLEKKKKRMIENDLKGRNIKDEKILEAFLEVPREKFVPERFYEDSYADRPLPIGEGQTISQPYIVAEMVRVANPSADDKALEVGSGSGYAAAILSRIVKKVYGIERFEFLVKESKKRLEELNYDNIIIKKGDGSKGWEEKSPFDIIIVSAAASRVPDRLLEQLAENGRMIIPIGNQFRQELIYYKKENGEINKKVITYVRFVPLISEEE
ncbi:MAG TPA: protein-L-isoaspartate(D-aspartate) O-methyltransferase [Halanaerobiales bacterium]|nr:protein-L-isoaspartate(D-aspartate) O-methyltransferase [Halanaerobiales bacterium]